MHACMHACIHTTSTNVRGPGVWTEVFVDFAGWLLQKNHRIQRSPDMVLPQFAHQAFSSCAYGVLNNTEIRGPLPHVYGLCFHLAILRLEISNEIREGAQAIFLPVGCCSFQSHGPCWMGRRCAEGSGENFGIFRNRKLRRWAVGLEAFIVPAMAIIGASNRSCSRLLVFRYSSCSSCFLSSLLLFEC